MGFAFSFKLALKLQCSIVHQNPGRRTLDARLRLVLMRVVRRRRRRSPSCHCSGCLGLRGASRYPSLCMLCIGCLGGASLRPLTVFMMPVVWRLQPLAGPVRAVQLVVDS